MTLCPVTSKQCVCQPDEGAFCPDLKDPPMYVDACHKAITELRADNDTLRALLRRWYDFHGCAGSNSYHPDLDADTARAVDDVKIMSEQIPFKQEIVFRPAFDKRHSDPKQNYGIHGVELAFYLTGPLGAIQFVVYTNWQLPHVQDEFDRKPLNDFPYMFHKPMPTDIGYHSPVPRYEGQGPMSGHCSILNGTCYYDGSSLNAEPVFNILLSEGSAGVWKEMLCRYHETFDPPA